MERKEEASARDRRKKKHLHSSDYDECDIILEYSQSGAVASDSSVSNSIIERLNPGDNPRETEAPEVLVLNGKNRHADYVSLEKNELEAENGNSSCPRPVGGEVAAGDHLSGQPGNSEEMSGRLVAPEANTATLDQKSATGMQPAPPVNVKYHVIDYSAPGKAPAGRLGDGMEANFGTEKEEKSSEGNVSDDEEPEYTETDARPRDMHVGGNGNVERGVLLDVEMVESVNTSIELEPRDTALPSAADRGKLMARPPTSTLFPGSSEKRGRTLAKRSVTLQREALSDIDDVSTDSEFIKVNVIDARDVPYRIPSGKNARPERQHSRPKPVGVKIKVNRHVVGSLHGQMPGSSSHSSIIEPLGQVSSQESAGEVHVVGQPTAVPLLGQLMVLEPEMAPGADRNKPMDEVGRTDGNLLEIVYDEEFTSMDAMDLLTEMKRHISQEGPANGQKPIKRFVIGNKQPMININEIVEIDDFRQRDLYDQVLRRTTRGYFIQCWVRVTNGMLICYRSKAAKGLFQQNPTNDFFQDPVKGSTFYERKFTIDLSVSKLYLGHEKQSWYSCGICCRSIPLVSEQMTDISNVKIRRIRQHGRNYVLEMGHNESSSTVVLSNLDFVFQHGDEFYYFRASSIDAFLKWVLTYHLRRERGIRRIEKLVD